MCSLICAMEHDVGVWTCAVVSKYCNCDTLDKGTLICLSCDDLYLVSDRFTILLPFTLVLLHF